MNKVTTKLQGGLGNYMFQISSAYAYSRKHDYDLLLSTYDSIKGHQHLDTYKDNILRNVEISSKNNIKGFFYYQEPHFHYAEIPNFNKNILLFGYFQSQKYFEGYDKEIKNIFSCDEDLRKNLVNRMKNEYGVDMVNDNTCSIHVRRGDYLDKPEYHPTQNMGYYIKAFKSMPKDSVFLIFSDDIDWCKENFPDIPEKFKFIEGNKDYEDLYLMSLCKNNIIANSSFSWWSAWLNQNENKKVIAPKKWFGPANSHAQTKDLYINDWILI